MKTTTTKIKQKHNKKTKHQSGPIVNLDLCQILQGYVRIGFQTFDLLLSDLFLLTYFLISDVLNTDIAVSRAIGGNLPAGGGTRDEWRYTVISPIFYRLVAVHGTRYTTRLSHLHFRPTSLIPAMAVICIIYTFFVETQ